MPSGRFFTGIMQLITSVGVAAGQYRRRSRITNPVVAQSLSGVRTSQHAGRTHAHCDRRWRLLKSTGQTKRIKPSTHVRVDDAGVAMHTSAASQAGIDAVGVRGAMCPRGTCDQEPSRWWPNQRCAMNCERVPTAQSPRPGTEPELLRRGCRSGRRPHGTSLAPPHHICARPSHPSSSRSRHPRIRHRMCHGLTGGR